MIFSLSTHILYWKGTAYVKINLIILIFILTKLKEGGDLKMFLSRLSEKEKKAFIVLARSISKADGIVEKEEEQLLQVFLKEMDLEEEKPDFSINDCYLIFNKSSNIVKRAIYVELLSLVISDKVYDQQEKEILNEIKNKLGLSESFVDEAFGWLNDYLKLVTKGFQLVEGVE